MMAASSLEPQGNIKPDSDYSPLDSFQIDDDDALRNLNHINGQDLGAGDQLKNELMDKDQEHQHQHQQSRNSRGGRVNRNSARPSTFSGTASPLRPTDFPLRILVLSDMVGAIIGRSGGTIRQITQQSRARVDVHRKENAGALEKVITIYGNPENCSSACQKILEVMQQESNNTNRGEIPLKILAHNNLIGRIIGKSGNTIKRIMEQTDTKITVSSLHDASSFNMERIITIKGQLDNICRAEVMISGKLRQSYASDLELIAPQALMFPGLHPMAMMSTLGTPGFSVPPPPPRGGHPGNPPFGMYNAPYPNVPPVMYTSGSSGSAVSPGSAFTAGLQGLQGDQTKETVYLYIPNAAVGAIIGTGGTTIREMISTSGASIKVAQPGKDETQSQQQQQQQQQQLQQLPQQGQPQQALERDRSGERKVTIVGNPEAQWKAQFMIFRKVGYEAFSGSQGPQEAELRVEIFVPSSHVGRIIGKGGTVVREMQRNTRATIKLPEESPSDSEETSVYIIGDFLSTQAAQRQIRALVNRVQVPSAGQKSNRQKDGKTNNQPQEQPQQQSPSPGLGQQTHSQSSSDSQ